MKILIAEDERNLSSALRQILESNGYFTDAVYDGAGALEYALEYAYDAIVLDVMMSGMDGFEAVSELRERGVFTPVLMLTARTATKDKVTGLNAGADDYMTKPFDTEELLARIGALTRRTGTVVMNKLSFADLTLELSSAMLYCGSEAVQLSRKEFEVARIFLLDPRATVTKDALIEQVWGIDSDATDNNVEAYISFLRKKLRYLKSTVAIRNIQRIGYRLEIPSC